MAFTGSAPTVFNLQGVVNILTKKAEKDLTGLEAKAKKAGSGMEGSFAGARSAILRIAGPAVLGALGAALATIGTQAVQVGIQLHDAMLQFQADVGASDKEAQAFGQTLGNLWRNNTDGMATLASTLTAIRQQFGDLGDETESVAQTFLDFSKVTGVDSARSTKLAANLLRQYDLELEQLPQVLNAVTKAQQETGASSEKLLDGLSKTAPITKNLGLSLQEAAAFMGLLEKSGAGVEASNETLRTFLRATTKATDEQSAAFRQLGIATNELGNPTDGAEKAFRALISRLEEGNLSVEETNAALALLGQEAGTKLIASLKGSEGAFQSLSGEVTNSAGTIDAAGQAIDKTFGERVTLAFRKAFGEEIVQGGQFFASVLEGIIKLLDFIVDGIKSVGTAGGFIFAELEATAKQFATGLEQILTGVFDRILDAFLFLVDSMVGALELLPDQLKSQFGGLQEDLLDLRSQLEGQKSGNSITQGIANIKQSAVTGITGGYVTTGLENFADAVNRGELSSTQSEAGRTQAIQQTTSGAIKGSAPVSGGTSDLPDLKKQAEERKKAAEDAKKVSEKAAADAAKEAEKRAKEQMRHNEEVRKAREQLQVETLQAQGKQTEALLLALDQERKEKLKTGLSKLEVDKWYAAEKEKIEADSADRAAKLETQILDAQSKHREAAIKNLELERDASIRAGEDKAKAEELFQAKKKKINEQYDNERLKSTEDLQKRILENQAAVGTDQMKNQEALLKAENIAKLAAYRDQIKAAREAGVEETTIQKFIASEKEKILKQSKGDGASEGPKSPLKSFEEAFSTGFGINFSLDSSGKKRGDPASQKAAKELADGLTGLGTPAPDTASQGINDTITIELVDQGGSLIDSKVVSRGGDDVGEFVSTYELGRL